MNLRGLLMFGSLILSVAVNAQELRAIKCADGKYGYRDETTLKWYIQPTYDNADDFDHGYGVVYVGGKAALIDAAGKYIVTPNAYSTMQAEDYGLKISQNGLFGIIDYKGLVVVAPKYDTMEPVTATFYGSKKVNGFMVSMQGKYGVIDYGGTEIIPCIYDEISNFLESLLIVVRKQGLYGAIDLNNMEIIPCKSKSKADIYGRSNKKWQKAVLQADANREQFKYETPVNCFVDAYTNALTKVHVQSLSSSYPQVTSKNTSLKQDGALYGIYDEDAAKWIVNPTYSMAYDAYNCYIVTLNGKFGIVDKQGVQTVACVYDDITINGDEALVAKKGDKFQLIDLTGKLANDIQFDMIGNFTGDGVAPARVADKYGVISDKGKMLCSLKYDKVEDYVGGFAKCIWKGYEGSLTTKGKERTDILRKLYVDAFRKGTIQAYEQFMTMDEEGRFRGDCYREMGTLSYNDRNDRKALEYWEKALKCGVENAAEVEVNIQRVTNEMMEKR